MLTRSIDQALEALTACRQRLPALRDLYREGSPERAALDTVLDAVGRADTVMGAGGSRTSSAHACGPR